MTSESPSLPLEQNPSMSVTKRQLARSINRPTKAFMGAVLELTAAQQEARSAVLTLGQARAVMTHLQRSLRLARWNLQPSEAWKRERR